MLKKPASKPSKQSIWESAKSPPTKEEEEEAAKQQQEKLASQAAAIEDLTAQLELNVEKLKADKSLKWLDYDEVSRIGNQFEKYAISSSSTSYSSLVMRPSNLQPMLDSMLFSFDNATLEALKAALVRDSALQLASAAVSKTQKMIAADGGVIAFPVFADWYPTIEHLQRKQSIVQKCSPSSVDWAQLRQQLPCGLSTEEHARREALFTKCDPNGNGFLSLAEIDKALRDELRIAQIFECKPVIMRAFQAARMSQPPTERNHNGDYVTKSTFRVLLFYLKEYFEMWQIFTAGDTNGDRRIDKAEFATFFEQLKGRWGWEGQQKDDDDDGGRSVRTADEVFHEIDENGGGHILFDEFAHWALMNNLSAD